MSGHDRRVAGCRQRKPSELRVQRIDFQEENRLWTLEGLKITAPVGRFGIPQYLSIRDGGSRHRLGWGPSRQNETKIFSSKGRPGNRTLKWGDKTLASNIPILYNRWNPVLVGDEEGEARGSVGKIFRDQNQLSKSG